MDFHAPIKEKKPIILQVPHLPTLHSSDGGADDNDDNDDESAQARVQPINIALLKDFMQKKVQKGIQEKKVNNYIEKNQAFSGQNS